VFSNTESKDANTALDGLLSGGPILSTKCSCHSVQKGMNHPTEVDKWRMYANGAKDQWEEHAPMKCVRSSSMEQQAVSCGAAPAAAAATSTAAFGTAVGGFGSAAPAFGSNATGLGSAFGASTGGAFGGGNSNIVCFATCVLMCRGMACLFLL